MPKNPTDFNAKTATIQADPLATRKLQGLREACLQVFAEREILGLPLDPRTIYDIALGRRGHVVETPSLVEVIGAYLDMQERMYQSNAITKNTILRYRSYKKALTEFSELALGKAAKIDELKPAIQYSLIEHFKGKKGFSHNYALKIIGFFRSCLTYAVANEWTKRNVLDGIKLKKYRKEIVVLSATDLDKVKALTLSDASAILVRDLFLFQVYTGFAFGDALELTHTHFFEFRGVQCILKPRKKNHGQGDSAFVPIFPDAKAIIDNYANDVRCKLSGKCLPAISIQKANKWLKILGISAGVKEVMTTHIGRKTFTRYVEDMGFTLNEMATMLGHTTASMTENNYYKRRREPVIERFKQVFGEPTSN